MTLIKKGKTKDVYKLTADSYLLRFLDSATGSGGVFDPGANEVGLSIEGMGRSGLAVSVLFFALLEKNGVKTHFISADVDKSEMIVKAAEFFGNGLEVVCRYRAAGSFIRRYGSVAEEGMELDGLVEFTLKDDARSDPPITKDTLAALGILSAQEYEEIAGLTKKASALIREALAEKGLELYDIKLEFGRVADEVVLIDEVSAGCMRVYKNNKPVEPLELLGLLSQVIAGHPQSG